MDPQSYEQRLMHYMLFRALTQGAKGRPRLPPELVVLIFRAAALTSREGSSSDAISGQANYVASSYGGRPERKDWFATAPLTHAALHRLAAVRLYTTSHDQGWADRPEFGSHTWFEIAIASPVAGANVTGGSHFAIAERADGTQLSWISHRNPVADRTPQEHRGEIFGPAHELWDHLRAGHVILVRACAQFAAWSNTAMEGSLRFTTFFEPTASLVDESY